MELQKKKKRFLKYLEKEEFEICYTAVTNNGLIFTTCRVNDKEKDDTNEREIYLWDTKNSKWLKINVASIIYIKFKTSDEILKLEETERIIQEQLELPIADSLKFSDDWWTWVMGQRKEWLHQEEEYLKELEKRAESSKKELKDAISRVVDDSLGSYGNGI